MYDLWADCDEELTLTVDAINCLYRCDVGDVIGPHHYIDNEVDLMNDICDEKQLNVDDAAVNLMML